jgi:hypothetical protein
VKTSNLTYRLCLCPDFDVRSGNETATCAYFHLCLFLEPLHYREFKFPWTDNIKMDLVETGWGGVDWIGLLRAETVGEFL